MLLSDGKTVRVDSCVLVWDGITKPEQKEWGLTHNVSVLVHPQNPAVPFLQQQIEMQKIEGRFKGNLPANANLPLNVNTDPKYGPEYINWLKFNASTTRGCPDVYDENGTLLDPMQLGNKLYPGCIIGVLANTWDYNNKQVGIAFGIQGLAIQDSTTPKMAVAGGMSSQETAAAFGHAAPTTAAPAVPGAAPAVPGAAPAVPGAAPDPNTGFAAGAPTAPGAAPVGPTYTMTAAAEGLTREQYHATGWTDEQLIQHGKMVAS